MQIEVNEIEPCKLSIKYTADAAQILDKRGEILNHFKKAPVPGFRQGKASIDAIKVHYRSQIDESLKRALAEDAYHNTLFEKKIKPHGAPRFNTLLLADGKFTCEFDLYTKPDFELQPYQGIEIPKPHEPQNVTELTEKLLQELRVRFGESAPYTDTDFVQDGDNVILDYEGSLNGEVVPHLCATGEMITVGRSNIGTFDASIMGMTLGETREFDLVVPDGGLASLSGKTVHLKVTLSMGSKTTPCPLDDTLAVKIGKKDMEELRMFAAGTAQASLQNKSKAELNEAVANKLVDMNTLNVPNWMTLSEAQYLVQNAKMEWALISDEDKEQYLTMAEKNVKLSLILDRIREENPEAQLTDQEVFDILKRNLAKTNVQQPLDEVIQQMNKSGYLQILFSRIRDEHAMDFITKQVKIQE
jgi:trigger factor